MLHKLLSIRFLIPNSDTSPIDLIEATQIGWQSEVVCNFMARPVLNTCDVSRWHRFLASIFEAECGKNVRFYGLRRQQFFLAHRAKVNAMPRQGSALSQIQGMCGPFTANAGLNSPMRLREPCRGLVAGDRENAGANSNRSS